MLFDGGTACVGQGYGLLGTFLLGVSVEGDDDVQHSLKTRVGCGPTHLNSSNRSLLANAAC